MLTPRTSGSDSLFERSVSTMIYTQKCLVINRYLIDILLIFSKISAKIMSRVTVSIPRITTLCRVSSWDAMLKHTRVRFVVLTYPTSI